MEITMLARTLILSACLLAGAASAQDEKKPSVTEAAGSLGGSVAGTVVGTTLGGPVGAVVGSTIGGAVGEGAGKVVHKVVHRKKKLATGQESEQVVQTAATNDKGRLPASAVSGGGVAPITDHARRSENQAPVATPQPSPTPEDDSDTYRPKTDDAPKAPGV